MSDIKFGFWVAIHKEENSCYGVNVLYLRGCFSAVDNLDDLHKMVTESVNLHIDGNFDLNDFDTIASLSYYINNTDYQDEIDGAIGFIFVEFKETENEN
jgi:predicted RNase H-like HicB family nuclease